MSYTSVMAIWPGEKVEELEELRNSHGSAPVVWCELSRRYLGGPFAYLFELEALTALQDREDIPDCLRAVFRMTFDLAYVLKEDFHLAAKHVREFLELSPPQEGRANHWPRIAEIFESNPDVPAIGFYLTSCSDNQWLVYEPDSESGEATPPDWSHCYNIYEEVK
jgi:hypothetical protein